MKLIRPGRHTQWFILALGLAIAVGLASLSEFPTPSSAQNTTAATTTAPAAVAPGLPCAISPVRNIPPNGDPLNKQRDPFKARLADQNLPAGLLPIDDSVKKSIMGSGLPCQEDVSPSGQEKVGLDNLQRGFDFYSWRTFIALNSPVDGTPIEQAQADAPTLWEDMNSFKQLLDVMLPANLPQPIIFLGPHGLGNPGEIVGILRPEFVEPPTARLAHLWLAAQIIEFQNQVGIGCSRLLRHRSTSKGDLVIVKSSNWGI